MSDFNNNIHLSRGRSSLLSALVVIILVLIGFQVLGSIIGLLLAILFVEAPLEDLAISLVNPSEPELRLPLLIMQGVATAIGMILVPLAYLKIKERLALRHFTEIPLNWSQYIIASVVVITFMGVNSIFIEWNMNISFPDFLSWFEEWARATEDRAAALTSFITGFTSPGVFVVALVVIAVLPAIGEELVFRGILQNEFHKGFGNIHIAIWVSAIIFSAIHMQFFGFIPRLLLGALFGYLYYWSGNLIIPIIAHFVNNGLTVLVIYLNNIGSIEMDLQNPEPTPLYAAAIFAIITGLLLFTFYRQSLLNRLKE